MSNPSDMSGGTGRARQPAGAAASMLPTAPPASETTTCDFEIAAGTSVAHQSVEADGAAERSIAAETRDEVTKLASEAKEQTAQFASQAKGHMVDAIADQKHRAADRLGTVAGVLRGAADKCGSDELVGRLGRYASGAADQVDALSRYVQGADVDSIVRDTGQFARRRPELFVGSAFVTGLLAGRFLRASGRNLDQPGTPSGGR